MSASQMPSLSTQGDPKAHRAESPHVVQFYSDEGFLLEELGHFVGTALASGGSAVVIATKAHEDNLARMLKTRGLDLTSLIADGRYVPLDAAEVLSRFMENGLPNSLSFAKYSVEWSHERRPRPRTKRARWLRSEKW